MTEAQYHIAVIGPKEMVSGFRALGAEIFPAESGTEVRDIIVKLKGQDAEPSRFAVILVTSTLLNEIPADEFAKLSRGALPAITAIPDLFSSDTTSEERLKKLAEQAIGSNILS